MGEQHYSFYAFAGGSGASRWKHETDDFQEASASANLLRPQHMMHAGEMHWSNFRHSIVQTLPHSWSAPEDTRFFPAHFERRRSGQARRSEKEAVASNVNDVDWRDDLLGGMRPHSATEHVREPNVLVAHLREGIQVIHLYSGRPVCQLALAAGTLYGDVNADSVIDKVEALAGSHGLTTQGGQSRKNSEFGCLALVSSGIPSTHQLFNGSICQENGKGTLQFLNKLAEEDIFSHKPLVGGFNSATSQRNLNGVLSFTSLFFVNSGLVTAFSSSGRHLWSTPTTSSWLDGSEALHIKMQMSRRNRGRRLRGRKQEEGSLAQAEDSGLIFRQKAFFPSLIGLSLQQDSQFPEFIAAVGEFTVSVLSRANGAIQAEAWLPSTPVSPPVVGDFNNDGVSDLLIMTTGGLHGLASYSTPGSRVFLVLLVFLLCILLVALLMKALQSSGKPHSQYEAPTRQKKHNWD
eukprot:g32257.t1